MILGAKKIKRLWTAEEDGQLREMVETGKSVTLMALRCKRTVQAVRVRLRFLKISVRRTGTQASRFRN